MGRTGFLPHTLFPFAVIEPVAHHRHLCFATFGRVDAAAFRWLWLYLFLRLILFLWLIFSIAHFAPLEASTMWPLRRSVQDPLPVASSV